MQAYKGSRNGHSLSHSTDLSKMFPLWSKAFSKKIKHGVRQEGRKECFDESNTNTSNLPEEINYFRNEDFKRTFSVLTKAEYENKYDYKNICLKEEHRLRVTYGYDDDIEYEFYSSGLSNKFYHAHN